MKKHTYFTLIELLTVLAIISILIAMLLPALSKAKSSAKNVICLSNLAKITVGMTLYANEFNNHLPVRYGNFAGYQCTPNTLKSTDGPDNFDDRPHLSPYYDMTSLQCPYLPERDLLGSTSTVVRSSYALWVGWKPNPADSSAMTKLRSTMTFRGEEFDIVASDHNQWKMNSLITQMAHQNSAGVAFISSPSATYDTQCYRTEGLAVLPPIDLNYTRIDGSTFTVRRVRQTGSDLGTVPGRYKNTVDNVFCRLPSTSY